MLASQFHDCRVGYGRSKLQASMELYSGWISGDRAMHLQNALADEIFVVNEPFDINWNDAALDEAIVPVVDHVRGVGRIKNVENLIMKSAAYRFLKTMPRYPKRTSISLLHYLNCTVGRGRKRLGRKYLRVRIRNFGKGLFVRIPSSDNVEKGIAVDAVD